MSSSRYWHIYTRKNMLTKLVIYATYAKYLTGINGGSMHIYMPHMKSLLPMMLGETIYTCNNDSNNLDDSDTNNANADNKTFRLNRLSCPMGPISQKGAYYEFITKLNQNYI